MAERDGYAAGTPCWVDVSSTDMEGSRRFYSELFGWNPQVVQQPDAQGYTLFDLKGKQVAGLGPSQEGWGPPAWSTYIWSDDADDTASRISAAGGEVLLEPMDVFDTGRMAFAKDPTGGVFGVWEPGTHRGSQLANEPGSFTWNELHTPDSARAVEFYGAVFGYGYEAMETDGPEPYQLLQVGGETVGAINAASSETPPHWLTYFSVADTDATVAKTKELGGAAHGEPFDTPFGRIAIVADPAGAVFGAIAAAQPDE